jgi:hypothetical protein
MKIRLISQNVSHGFLIFRKDFIRYLVAQGHEVFAFALDYTPTSQKAVEDLGAIPVSYQLNKTGLNPIRDVRDTYRLYKALKELAPDVLKGLGYIHTPGKQGMSLKKRLLQRIYGLMCSMGYALADKSLFLNSDDPKYLSRVAFLN